LEHQLCFRDAISRAIEQGAALDNTPSGLHAVTAASIECAFEEEGMQLPENRPAYWALRAHLSPAQAGRI
jgi:hypothetical protein